MGFVEGKSSQKIILVERIVKTSKSFLLALAFSEVTSGITSHNSLISATGKIDLLACRFIIHVYNFNLDFDSIVYGKLHLDPLVVFHQINGRRKS